MRRPRWRRRTYRQLSCRDLRRRGERDDQRDYEQPGDDQPRDRVDLFHRRAEAVLERIAGRRRLGARAPGDDRADDSPYADGNEPGIRNDRTDDDGGNARGQREAEAYPVRNQPGW